MTIHPSGPYQSTFKDADCIRAIDPKDRSWYLEVWGSDIVPPCRRPGSGPRAVKVVQVEIDRNSDDDLQNLLRRVLEIKGRLPGSVHDRLKT
jgi:hypothetical protein